MIEGTSLLRILDGSGALLHHALARIAPEKRGKHKDARLVGVDVDDFMYVAKFRSNAYGGLSVLGETPSMRLRRSWAADL
jgi:hypothetical protein